MGIVRQSLHVSVGHRYWNNLWSHEQNQAIYGESASPLGVGSNLRVDVEAEGAGLIGSDLSPALKHVKETLDHRCLYSDGEAFQNRPSTLEDITQFMSRRLFAFPLNGGCWKAVTVWELDRYGCRVEPTMALGEVVFFERYRNLTLSFQTQINPETHLAVSRQTVVAAIDEVFAQFRTINLGAQTPVWGAQLFDALKKRLPQLREVAVDLGCHGSLRLADAKVELQ